MDELIFKTKKEKETYRDCVVYLLQLCNKYAENECSIFCLDVATKALFLYNLSPKSFGNVHDRKEWLDAINRRIDKYKSNKRYNTNLE